jgi:uncharacterized protein YjaZ
MSISFHILDASRRLERFKPQLVQSAKAGLDQIERELSLPAVDVVIVDDPQSAIPETGVGGSAPTAHLLYIYIDPEFADLQKTLEFEIKSTLAHELHHCARWASIGYGSTLLEAVVSEGLADHFDIEINGGTPKPWDTAIQGEDLEVLLEKAKPESNSTNYDHAAWFYGSAAIPRWAGYSLGFKLVGDYMQLTQKKASELVSEPASSFIS